MTATFHMMVGLPASGKSFLAQTVAFAFKAQIMESDAIRKEWYGSAETQGDANKIFEEMHVRSIDALKNGQSVVYDGTNINYKHRMATIQRVSKTGCRKVAWVMMTDVNVCKMRNEKRERIVPAYVIDRMWKSFAMPQYWEGWDEIHLVFSYDAKNYLLTPYLESIENFEQENPHHSMTLGEHTRAVVEGVPADYKLLRYVALLHDNGKRFTKTFKNTKGEETNVAHFYGHENCGAYEAALFMDAAGFKQEEVIYGCGLINLHMRPYGIENNRKAHDKLIDLIGAGMYSDLMILNDADRNAK